MRPTLFALGLGLAACGHADRRDSPATRTTPAAVSRGPDILVLRIPRSGGTARVFAYPRLDTLIWSGEGAPAPARIVAFDDEAGRIAYEDARGQPARVDFRQGGTGVVSKARLTAITSDGSSIYAIVADGSVQRYSESGTWKWKPPLAARAVFPQPDATLLVLGERKSGSILWRLRPPSTDIADSVILPRVDRALRTQVGDRLYLAADRELTGVRTRTMERIPSLTFEQPVEMLAATPSGDRVFVVTRGSTRIDVIDRYREAVSGQIELGRNIADLRVDPLGRYLLVHPEKSDSAIVIALGTSRVVGVLPGAWRADLPFVAPDGGIVLAQGPDVVIANGETLRAMTRVRGGTADFWYAFRWSGFRPRDAALDRPVEFATPAVDSTRSDSGAAAIDSSATRTGTAATAPPPDNADARPRGFTVSFAALLVADKANDLARQISVNGEHPRVVTVMRDGSQIYRVVLGPYATREEAERIGRESRQSYWIYEGGP